MIFFTETFGKAWEDLDTLQESNTAKLYNLFAEDWFLALANNPVALQSFFKADESFDSQAGKALRFLQDQALVRATYTGKKVFWEEQHIEQYYPDLIFDLLNNTDFKAPTFVDKLAPMELMKFNDKQSAEYISLDNKSGIYCIYMQIDNFYIKYVGLATNLSERLRTHARAPLKKDSYFLHASIKKLASTFTFYCGVLEFIDRSADNNTFTKKLRDLEVDYIKKYNTYLNGLQFNSTRGGDFCGSRSILFDNDPGHYLIKMLASSDSVLNRSEFTSYPKAAAELQRLTKNIEGSKLKKIHSKTLEDYDNIFNPSSDVNLYKYTIEQYLNNLDKYFGNDKAAQERLLKAQSDEGPISDYGRSLLNKSLSKTSEVTTAKFLAVPQQSITQDFFSDAAISNKENEKGYLLLEEEPTEVSTKICFTTEESRLFNTPNATVSDYWALVEQALSRRWTAPLNNFRVLLNMPNPCIKDSQNNNSIILNINKELLETPVVNLLDNIKNYTPSSFFGYSGPLTQKSKKLAVHNINGTYYILRRLA